MDIALGCRSTPMGRVPLGDLEKKLKPNCRKKVTGKPSTPVRRNRHRSPDRR
jgi:hypothetical protein